MDVNGTPILLWHVWILQDNHQGIYSYTAFTFEINKICISSYIIEYIVKISNPYIFTTCYVSVVWFRPALAFIIQVCLI
jgi:hypothetical protein